MKESRLKTLMLTDLKSVGWYARRCSVMGVAGFPDLIAAKNGKFVAIELKQANSFEQLRARQTTIQKYHEDEIAHAGNVYMLIGSAKDRGVYVIIRQNTNVEVRKMFSTYNDFFRDVFDSGLCDLKM